MITIVFTGDGTAVKRRFLACAHNPRKQRFSVFGQCAHPDLGI